MNFENVVVDFFELKIYKMIIESVNILFIF